MVDSPKNQHPTLNFRRAYAKAFMFWISNLICSLHALFCFTLSPNQIYSKPHPEKRFPQFKQPYFLEMSCGVHTTKNKVSSFLTTGGISMDTWINNCSTRLLSPNIYLWQHVHPGHQSFPENDSFRGLLLVRLCTPRVHMLTWHLSLSSWYSDTIALSVQNMLYCKPDPTFSTKLLSQQVHS